MMRKKLKLNKETLRALTVRNLEGIHGGASAYLCSHYCDETIRTCYESCIRCTYTCDDTTCYTYAVTGCTC